MNGRAVANKSARLGVLAASLLIGCGGGGGRDREIAVISPNGGETWTVGTSAAVVWSAPAAVDRVTIELSTDAGQSWTALVTDTANDGREPLTVPDASSVQCLIRVVEDGYWLDVSDSTFSICEPMITVTSPDGGEEWPVGRVRAVSWISTGVTQVRIELSRDGGTNWEELVASTDAAAGYCPWTVTDGGQAFPQTSCRIRVADAAGVPFDESDSNFAVCGWGGIWRVDKDAPSGGDGLSWQTAFEHPRNAADVALPGDEIWVAEGTYTRRHVGDTVLLAMKEGVAMYGGFAGNEAARGERDVSAHPTRLDGETAVYHVVTGASDAVLDGFIVRGGNADVHEIGNPLSQGGGMYNYGVSNLVVASCTFRDNSVEYYGAGMYNWGSSLAVRDCKFLYNSAIWRGGGMYNATSGSLVVDGCTFSANTTYYGGGMYNCYSSPTVRNCTFSGNPVTQYGAGMHNQGASPLIADCTFNANSATWHGGGMYNREGSSPVVVNCRFSDNSADEGGGMYSTASSPRVVSSTFYRNVSDDCGGGMRNGYGSATVVNCTFSANKTDDHGEGGGMYNVSSAVSVRNCVLWGDDAPSAPEIYNDVDSTCTVDYSDILGGYVGTGNKDQDPLFASPATGDLHLLAGSPCIDAADGAAAPAADKDGTPRVDDPATANAGAGSPDYADMGAYECIPAASEAVTVTAPDGGERWAVGSTREIAWSAVGVMSVRVELSRDDGVTWETLVGLTDASAGTYSWIVADGGSALPQAQCVVRVSDAADGDPSDSSGEVFVIWDGALRVDLGAPPGGDGLSWGTAFQHPQDAMDVASAGEEIWVAEGTYTRRSAGDEVLLATKDGVAVYGGFAGNETARSERDWNARPTMLDGETAVYHVVTGASDAVLDGFIVRGGNADASDEDAQGGGMSNICVSTLEVANCTFSGNSSRSGGAGMYNDDSALTIRDCTFIGNATDSSLGGGVRNAGSSLAIADCSFLNNSGMHGGGMASWESTLSITGCTFSGNSAGNGGEGGALYNSRAWLNIEDCTFSANTADGKGGAMYSYAESSADIVRCRFLDNSAINGGAVYVYYRSSVALADCIFAGNTARYGGGMYMISGSTVIDRCTFAGNSAVMDGGGMDNSSDEPVSLTNSVFFGNSATKGGGVRTGGVSLSITNCTFCGNIAEDEGGGIRNSNVVTLVNCILWGNVAPDRAEIWTFPGATTIMAYSDVQGGHVGIGNVAEDPLFVDAGSGDLRLRGGSPCIDAADGDAASATDRDGYGRIDDPATPDAGAGAPSHVDIGAYEYHP